MKGKILFLTGLGVGYVLGTRAGRERYEQIKTTVERLWNDPRLQRQVDTVGAYVKDKAPEVVEFVSDGAKKVAAQVSGTKKKPATSSGTAKSSTAKSGSTTSSSATSAPKRPTGSSAGSS